MWWAGEKRHLACLRQYLAVVTSRSAAALGSLGDSVAPPPTLYCYDFSNKLIAASLPLSQVTLRLSTFSLHSSCAIF